MIKLTGAPSSACQVSILEILSSLESGLGLNYSIPISIAHFCCVLKLTNEASTFPPNPDVGSLFLYWDRGGAHSQRAPLCPEAVAMAQLSGIYTTCIVRYALAGLSKCVQRWVGVQSEW
jgi:hypothetical protein